MPPKLQVYVYDTDTGDLFRDNSFYSSFLNKIDEIVRQKQEAEQATQQHARDAIDFIEQQQAANEPPNHEHLQTTKKNLLAEIAAAKTRQIDTAADEFRRQRDQLLHDPVFSTLDDADAMTYWCGKAAEQRVEYDEIMRKIHVSFDALESELERKFA